MMKPGRGVLLSVAAVASLVTSDPLSATIGGTSEDHPIPTSFFGMTFDHASDWPTVPIGAVGHEPAIGWYWHERTKGTFTWAGVDGYVSAAEQHGVDFIYELGGNVPAWASSRPNEPCQALAPNDHGCAAPPANIQDWDDYVTAVVTRYKRRIKFYEIWNEPNNPRAWSGTFAQLVELARHAHTIIKAIDAKAQVLTPAPAGPGAPWEWMEQYLDAGGGPYADIGAFHGYMAASWVTPYPFPEDETTSGCAPPGPRSNCSGSVLTKVARFRSAFDNGGMLHAPMFDTEGSWGKGTITDPDQQVAWLARWLLLQASAGVSRVYWYAWGPAPDPTTAWGALLDLEGNITAAGVAYGQLERWLAGATITQPCARARDAVWTCGLSRAGYLGLVVWNTSGPAPYTVPSQYVQHRDLAGNIALLPVKSILVGAAPILLETGPAPR